MTHPTAHLDPNALAALAESGLTAAGPETLAHLARCPDCLAAWSAAVRQHDQDLVARQRTRETNVFAADRHRPRFIIPRPAWSAGGLAAAIFVFMILMPHGPRVADLRGPESAIVATLSSLSQVGPLYPRVATLPGADAPRYRGANGSADEAAMDAWRDRLVADPADTESAFWLGAGCLAAGRLQEAIDVLRRALAERPTATDLLLLQAIAAYRDNDLARAEDSLLRVLARQPKNDLANLNLALLLLESDREASARALLERLSVSGRTAIVRQRAAQSLATLQR